MNSQYLSLFVIVLVMSISTKLKAQFFDSELTSDNLIFETIFGGYEANYGLDSMVIATDLNTTKLNSIEMTLNGIGSVEMNNSGSISVQNYLNLDPGDALIFSELISPNGSDSDGYAVHGVSASDDFYGYGVVGQGGYQGVRGIVVPSQSGAYYGVRGFVNGGSGANYAIYGSSNGAGTNYAGYFSGNATVTGVFNNPSDLKLKKDIDSYDYALEKLMLLETKTYRFQTEKYESMYLPKTKQYGFIAQELQAVFPELVNKNIHASDDKSEEVVEYLGVNYLGLIPILTQAIQEQQQDIELKESEIAILKKQVVDLQTKFEILEERVTELKKE